MTKNLILVRHLHTNAPVKNAFYGSTDLSILPGEYPEIDIGLNTIYCSPMKRCRETAQYYFPNTSLNIIDNARECDFGDWEGKTFSEIAESYPKEVEDWKSDTDFAFPAGEKVKNFAARVERTAKELIQKDEETILLLTHAGVIRFMLCHFLGISDDKFLSFDVEPGSFSAIKVFENGSGVIHKLNSTGDQTWLKLLL